MTIDQLETPALIVDLDILERNIFRLADYARQHNLRLRPHTKTHKTPKIAHLQCEAGAWGVTVAKVGEAEVMARRGLDNILIAYPVFGDSKVQRVAKLAASRRVTVAVDNAITAEYLSLAVQAAHSIVDILVELDVGMRRCGVACPEEAVKLAEFIDKMKGVRFAGLTLYPGHIWARPEDQAEPLHRVAENLSAVLNLLAERGLHCEVVSGGSTPTALQSHLVADLTEIRPGTYVFNDRNTVGAGACTISDCALRVLVTVVSNAVSKRAIVDGGSKTFSSDQWLSGGKCGYGYVVEDPQILVSSMSEEHGHLDVSNSASSLRIGDRLSIIPNHVCACVNLHDRIWYHRQGIIEGFWNVEARGRVA
jgi:D-serine deaminase-like pyridoxal phosphate-dependent protein